MIMGLSRQEINLRRLLAKCELKCKSEKDELLEKYIDALEDMMQEVKKSSGIPMETVKQYQRRILNIKTALGIKTVSKYEEFNEPLAMREHLLGVRQRNVNHEKSKEADLDQVLKHQEDAQNKIAEEVLEFTKALKEQSQIANRIIRKDTEVKIASNSTQLTDQSFSKLATESTKLQEHSKKAWKCWLYLMLVVVMVIFINMVLFMKVMKKSK